MIMISHFRELSSLSFTRFDIAVSYFATFLPPPLAQLFSPPRHHAAGLRPPEDLGILCAAAYFIDALL